MIKSRINVAITFLLCSLILVLHLKPNLSSVVLLALSIVGLGKAIIFKDFNRAPLFLYFLLGAYGVRILWVINVSDMRYALSTLETEALIVVTPLLYMLLGLTTKQREFAIKFFIWYGIGVMVYSFGTLLLFVSKSDYTIGEYLTLHFITAQYYAQKNMIHWSFSHYSFLSASLIYGLHLLVYATTPTFKRIVLPVYTLLLILFIVFVGSRIGMALLIILIISYFVIAFREKYVVLGASFFALMACTVAYIAIDKSDIKSSLCNLEPQRCHLLTIGVDAFEQRPMIGGGTGYQRELFKNETFVSQSDYENKTNKISIVNHPHNQYLTELIQFGIIGSLPFLLFLISTILYSIRSQNWALLNVMISMGAFMMVESPLNSNKGLLPFAIVLLLLIPTSRNRESDSPLAKL